jgi:very-short-patch-repair endonuclease
VESGTSLALRYRLRGQRGWWGLARWKGRDAMTDTLRRLVRDRVEEFGWRSGTDLEDAVAIWLHRAGHHPGRVKQQCRVGRFRLDFAFPDIQIAIEADGWHHRSPEGAAWDAERDSWLRSLKVTPGLGGGYSWVT